MPDISVGNTQLDIPGLDITDLGIRDLGIPYRNQQRYLKSTFQAHSYICVNCQVF